MDPSQIDPLTLAARAGTLNSPDRSKQYRRTDNEELLRSLNELWKTARLNENAVRDRDRTIAELHERLAQRDKLIKDQARYVRGYRIVNIALTSIITGLAWEGLRAVLPIALRWFGFN
jgi:hypothetical protein